MESFALDRLEPYHACRLVSTENSEIGERLKDMGLTPGTVVTRLFAAPCGDPVAYEVRGTALAIRRSDAGRILVRAL